MPASAITIAILAMGGEGGGVLADWIVDLAERAGFYAQTTSVPGVAQRTGSTIYYLELFPAAAANAAGKDPVLALMPVPGELDIVIASELMEAGRAIQRGLVTPNRTTLIASTHRVYSMTEKTAAADGRVDPAAFIEAGATAARNFVRGDFARIAEENRSVISAPLFGALAATAALPFDRSQFEEAIRTGGVGVDSSLSAFAAGFEAAAEAPNLAAPPPAFGVENSFALFPAAVHRSLAAGLASSGHPPDAALPEASGVEPSLAEFPAAAQTMLDARLTSAGHLPNPAAPSTGLGIKLALTQLLSGGRPVAAGAAPAGHPPNPAPSTGLGVKPALTQLLSRGRPVAADAAPAGDPPNPAAPSTGLGIKPALIQLLSGGRPVATDAAPAGDPPNPAAPQRDYAANPALIQFPVSTHPILAAGFDRLAGYQDSRYAAEYLEMLHPVRDADAQHGNGEFTLLRETGRYLALWMSYEDAIRVADMKTRGARFDRVRREARATPAQIVRIHEFLHPGVREIADILPAALGRWLLNTGWARRFVERCTGKGKVIETTSLGGFLQLYILAALRPWRRKSLRWQRELAKIRGWLAQIPALAAEDYALACEAAKCPRLVKGYGETYIDGIRRFDAVMAALPTLRRGDDTAQQFERLRETALAGDDQKLAAALQELNGVLR